MTSFQSKLNPFFSFYSSFSLLFFFGDMVIVQHSTSSFGTTANATLLCSLSDTLTGTEEGRELQQLVWDEIVDELKRQSPILEQLV